MGQDSQNSSRTAGLANQAADVFDWGVHLNGENFACLAQLNVVSGVSQSSDVCDGNSEGEFVPNRPTPMHVKSSKEAVNESKTTYDSTTSIDSDEETTEEEFSDARTDEQSIHYALMQAVQINHLPHRYLLTLNLVINVLRRNPSYMDCRVITRIL